MATARTRRLAACVIAAAVLASAWGSSALAATDAQRRARAGVGYLASQQRPSGAIVGFSSVGSTADAVVSMVDAGRGAGAIRDALRYLSRRIRAGAVTTVGQRAQVALAVAAAGGDPRAFGGHDLVRELRRTEQPDGRYGHGTDVYEHALAMLALAAASAGPSRAATRWLAAAQCRDGGWQNDDPAGPNDDRHCRDQRDPASDFTSDTNTTGIAVQALLAAPSTISPRRDPFRFFRRIRDAAFGGWGYTWGFRTTDADSTALVLAAYAASGRTPPNGAVRALKALQYARCGAWAYSWTTDGHGRSTRSAPNVGATIDAIQGVLQRPLPIGPRAVTRPAPDLPAC
jgi:hypothetical protein